MKNRPGGGGCTYNLNGLIVIILLKANSAEFLFLVCDWIYLLGTRATPKAESFVWVLCEIRAIYLPFLILWLHGYFPNLLYVLIECRIQIEIHSVYEWIRIRAREFLFTGLPTGYGSGTPVHFHGNKSFGKKVSVVHNLKSGTFIFYQEKAQ